MHGLLERQLCELRASSAETSFEEFVAAVDAAYLKFERARQRIGGSLELVSEELLERNRQLREQAERRRQLEAELSRAEELRAVGQLAVGIAQELSTPIQQVSESVVLLQNAVQTVSALLERSRQGEGGRVGDKLESLRRNMPEAVESALEACARVAEMVKAMQLFARPDHEECAPADINRALTNALAVARSVLGYTGDVDLRLRELPLVNCWIGDINRVFLNLIVNAAHAAAKRDRPDGGRGQLRISTREGEGRVFIVVEDDGCGIPEAIQRRIFEPSGSSKYGRRGMGQPLSVSRSIVAERHGGCLSFRSILGKGTVFTVELPLYPPDAAESTLDDAARVAFPEASSATAAPRGVQRSNRSSSSFVNPRDAD